MSKKQFYFVFIACLSLAGSIAVCCASEGEKQGSKHSTVAFNLNAAKMGADAAAEKATQAQAKTEDANKEKPQEDVKKTDVSASDDENDDFEDLEGIEDTLPPPPKDPLESFNRAMFKLNDKLDAYILKPAASFYDFVLPAPVSKGIHNVFLNFRTIVAIPNDLLQANFYQANSDIWRLLINSTAGIGSFFDVASKIGLPYNQSDFGLTLAKWGYKNSTYVVWPFWGPSTIRDTIGLPVDYYTSIYFQIQDVALRNSLYAMRVVDARAQLLRFDKVYKTAALDKYVFMRNAYFQRRNYLIERSHELDNPYQQQTEHIVSQEDYYLDE